MRSVKPAAVPSGTGGGATADIAEGYGVEPTRLQVAPTGPVGIPVGRLKPALEDLGALLEDVLFYFQTSRSMHKI